MANAPFTSDDYTLEITSQHLKPKFISTVQATVQPLSDIQFFIDDLPAVFDLDVAIGVQLDAVGAWVGISRYVSVPLINVWFSFDIEGRGFDQAAWQQPYDPETGVSALDDDTYRRLIKYKILVNTWDGLLSSALKAFQDFYAYTGCLPFIVDGGDMEMTVCISGARLPPMLFVLYAGRYVEFKPAGVTLHNVVPSVPDTAVFGFDVDNEYIGGWDSGSWARDAYEVMIEELSE